MYLSAGRFAGYDSVLLSFQTNIQLCDSVNGNTVFISIFYIYFP